MIDMHCHLLPGIDDGARDLNEALELARYAVDHGITHAVMTPHINPGTFNNSKASITRAVASFRTQLAEHDIALNIAVGAEVRICVELLDMIVLNQIPFLGELDGYRIMLLEFPHSHILPGSDKLVQHLLDQNIRPLIAHPERNKAVHANPDRIAQFVAMGCLLQVTADSVAGRFGKASKRTAAYLLKKGWVYVLATDAHHIKHRPPELMGGVRAAARLIGDSAASALVNSHPFSIVGIEQFDCGLR